MRTLSDFIKCNMEDLSSPRVADQQYWVDMLVSAPSSPKILLHHFLIIFQPFINFKSLLPKP